MKKLFWMLIIALLSATTIQAQTVEEILNNYFENIGGKDKWANIKSMKIEGTMSMQGMDLPLTVYSKAPNKEYVEMSVMDKTIIEAFDGESSWRVNPFMGGTEPQKGTPEETEKASKEQFQNEFINYKDKGHTITLEGKEEIEGTLCFKLKMVKVTGEEEIHFFDEETYVPIMIRTTITQEGFMKGKIAETYFSDYDEVGDGLIMAMYTESKMDGQTLQKMTIEKVEINPEIDDSQFTMPE
ncbi:MAG: hypothetical protein DWQ02_04500 [Bacteroidetes bacterium]|nr:MAG: hypothetical protein DWQ02_04500 [Bacteroidota bacterium]